MIKTDKIRFFIRNKNFYFSSKSFAILFLIWYNIYKVIKNKEVYIMIKLSFSKILAQKIVTDNYAKLCISMGGGDYSALLDKYSYTSLAGVSV